MLSKMSSEGENSKDISTEVDKVPSEKIEESADSHKEGKEENEVDKSKDAEVASSKLSDNEEKKDKKDNDVKKDVHLDNSDQSKEDKKKPLENSEGKTDDDTEEGDDSSKEEEVVSKKQEKEEVPLLDQPLEQSGSRERKKVQRFNEELAADVKEAKTEVSAGTGTQLGEIPRIDASISRFKNDDLKLLHRLLFKIPGKTTLIKKNIKKFNGFDFKKDSEEYARKIDSAKKFEIKQLKSICEMLDLEKKGVKEEIVQRIIDFLIEPKDSGKPVGGGRPKRTAAVRANNRGYSSHDDSYSSDERRASRGGRGKGRRTNLKDDTTSESDEDFHPSDASETRPKVVKRKRGGSKKGHSEDDDLEDDASEVDSVTSEDSDDEPKKRKKVKKVPNNSRGRGRPPTSRGRKPAAELSEKKTVTTSLPAKKGSNKLENGSSEESEHNANDNASSSEDEPLIKKAKTVQPPTDEEIKKYVKEILDGANLEEITMKTVCKQVYAHYPDFDLAHKKAFIKDTVRSLIST